MYPANFANPPAPYLGGKRNLAGRICPMIDATPHRHFVDTCVGMGGIFLRRKRAVTTEVINDVAGDVANLFRVVRKHYEPFVDELCFLFASREEFDRQKRVDPTTLTDIERAARFLYLQRLSFGGKVDGRHFGVDVRTASRFNLAKLRGELKLLARRLEPVKIEQLDFAALIPRYDTPETLFYLDPPYDQTEGYGIDFPRDRYVEMAELLASVRGRFILSINATPFIRDAFARFDIQEVQTTWTLSTAATGGGKRVGELIITNRR